MSGGGISNSPGNLDWILKPRPSSCPDVNQGYETYIRQVVTGCRDTGDSVDIQHGKKICLPKPAWYHYVLGAAGVLALFKIPALKGLISRVKPPAAATP